MFTLHQYALLFNRGCDRGVVQIFDSRSDESLKIADLVPSLTSKKCDKARKAARTRKAARNGNAVEDTTKNMRQEEEGAKVKLRIKTLVVLFLFEIYLPVTSNEVQMISYVVRLQTGSFAAIHTVDISHICRHIKEHCYMN